MLEEIQYGIDHGFRYFYPGYFVPGVDRFDYKLRMGKPEEMEFFDLKFDSWEPFTRYSVEEVLELGPAFMPRATQPSSRYSADLDEVSQISMERKCDRLGCG